MKFKNIKKGRVIEHKKSGAIAIVHNIRGGQAEAELLFQGPDLNPHDSGYATHALDYFEAEQYRLINRPVVGVVYNTNNGFAAACDGVFDTDPSQFSEVDGYLNDYSPTETKAIGFI